MICIKRVILLLHIISGTDGKTPQNVVMFFFLFLQPFLSTEKNMHVARI